MINLAVSSATPDPTHQMLMTMAIALSMGVFLIAIARRFGFPAIVLLLAGGIFLGPLGVGYVQPDSLGDGLRVIVMFGIGLILFEGGLTLDIEGYRSASTLIKRLLSFGVVITWLTTALAIYLIFNHSIGICLLAASLVIVTGPTVIAPLIKRIQLVPRLHNILHWEGVLIDPVGVFVALLVFEWFEEHSRAAQVLTNFGFRFFIGAGVGLIGGYLIYQVVRKRWVPEDMVSITALAASILIFGVAEMVVSEAGLLSVAVAGMFFGFRKPGKLKQIKQFKAEVIDLCLGTLFILLSARLSFDQFESFGMRGFLLVVVVMLVVRPLSIYLCTSGLDFNIREKIFLGWVAPRGIVAASMASLFSLLLEQRGGFEDPRFIETFVYSVIISTIVFQGFTAGPLARLLKLRREKPRGWVIVGAHSFGREVAKFIRTNAKVRVVLVDTNVHAVSIARKQGLEAMEWDATDRALQHTEMFDGVGNVLAITDNQYLNIRICETWSDVFGKDSVYFWTSDANQSEEEAGDKGKIVWAQFPRPSRLADNIIDGSAVLLEGSDISQVVQDECVPLLSVIGDRVFIDEAGALECPVEDIDNTLYIKRQSAPSDVLIHQA